MESLYRVRLPIKYHHQVCSTTKYHHFFPLQREIEVYLSLSRHDAFFQGSKKPCRTLSPDDSSRQMARHSCGRVHRALGCPVSNNRLAQFGAKNGWVLMTTMKCSATTCKAHDQHEQIMKTSWIDANPKWCFYWRGKTFQSSMSPWAWYTIKWSVEACSSPIFQIKKSMSP